MIVALDTAGPWVCVACGTESAVHRVRRDALANHNEMLPGLVSEVVRDSSHSPTALAVNVGPGSFTGTRVGVSFVAGWAQSLGLGVLPVSSFVVAAHLADPSAGRVMVALPLVRGVWGLSELTQADGLWREGEWRELSTSELEGARRGGVLVCPWGDYPAEVTPPAHWNPAALLVQLALAAPPEAFVAPRHLAVRYLGTSQAERKFHARRGL